MASVNEERRKRSGIFCGRSFNRDAQSQESIAKRHNDDAKVDEQKRVADAYMKYKQDDKIRTDAAAERQLQKSTARRATLARL